MRKNSTKVTPFIIGLTGAIGTGKSLVRKMLQHKGALTIDADRLAHGAYTKGTKGFHTLVQLFGNEILDKDGQIDRKQLGELVFNNSQALLDLEFLIHPLVIRAIKRIIVQSPLPIIVIEAIKLLESDLHKHCDVIWEVTAHPEDIYERLSKTRGMNRASVDERLGHQYFQKIDKPLIDTTILNQGNINDLWVNVSARWDELSIKSVTFGTAFKLTRELMEPFQNFLIQQDSAFQVQAIIEINKRGLLFLPVRNLDSGNLQNLGENSYPSYLNENPYQYFLWKSEEKTGKILYLICDIDNFISTSAASVNQFDPDEFIKLIGIVQDFSRIHMCEKFFFPFNKDSARLYETLGFKKSSSHILPGANLSPLGYNLLYKQLRPPLELFREK